MKGPPYQIGAYVVTKLGRFVSGKAHYVWRVYMRPQFTAPLFESPRKRDAIRYARRLERARFHILRALTGDPVAVSENAKIVDKLRHDEELS